MTRNILITLENQAWNIAAIIFEMDGKYFVDVDLIGHENKYGTRKIHERETAEEACKLAKVILGINP